MGAAAAVALRGAVCAALLQVGTTSDAVSVQILTYFLLHFGYRTFAKKREPVLSTGGFRNSVSWFLSLPPRHRVVCAVLSVDGTVLVFFNKLQKQNVDPGRRFGIYPRRSPLK